MSTAEISALAAGTHPSAVWKGTSTAGFENASNWSGGVIPDPYSRVVIQTGTFQPIMTGAVTFAGLTIDTGAVLNLNGHNLTISDLGLFTNYGTLRLKNTEALSGLTVATDKGSVMLAPASATSGLAAGNAYYNLTLSGTGSVSLSADLAVSGALVVGQGTMNANGEPVTVTGPMTASGGEFLASTESQSLNGGLTISGGTYRGSTGNVDINGDLLLSAGTFVAPTGSGTVSGDWTKSGGTFVASGGTITLDGADQTISGSTVFANLTKIVSTARTLTFAAGTTQTMTGTLTLEGTAGNPLSLRSSMSGAQWLLDPQSARALGYVDVQDSNNLGAAIDCSAENCLDSGNNTNWQFITPAVSFESGALTFSETAGTVSVTVTLSGTSLFDVTIPYAVGGTATGSGSDFVIVTPSPLILEAGETSTGIILTLIDDSEVESDETIVLTLGTPANAVVGSTGSVTIMLTSDDTAPSSSPPAVSATSGGRGGGGGRRGESIATTIARARAAILLRFAERSAGESSQSSSSDASSRDAVTGPRPQTPRRTAGDRTALIAERRDRLVVSVRGTDVFYWDIPLAAWFSPYVAAVLETGVAEGYRDAGGEVTGEFGVANPATLAEVLKMSLAAEGSKPSGGKTRNESAQGTWAAGYVATAESLQLSVFASTVDVMRPATRAETVQTILEVFAFPIANQPAPFHDVPADHPFSKSIATAAFYELVSGDSSKEGPLWRFRPDEPINRAEVSKLIALVQESVSR